MLSNGRQRFAGDDGAPDGDVAAKLSAYAMGQATEQAALAALSGSRLLVPLVEREAGEEDSGACGHAHGGPGGGEPGSVMAMPRLIGADGRPAILAFTSLEALAGWRPDARPVPAGAREVWSTATEECCAVVIDVAGPVPLAVEGARLAALAAGEPPPAPYADPDVYAQVEAAIADEPAIDGAELAEGLDGTDLAVRLILGPGSQAGGGPEIQAAVRRAAEAIAARLAPRLRRGIAISAAPGPAPVSGPDPASARAPGPASARAPGPASARAPGPASARAPGPASTSVSGSGPASVPGSGPASVPGSGPASVPGSVPISGADPAAAPPRAPRPVSRLVPPFRRR